MWGGSLPIRPFSVRYLRFFFSLRTFYPATLQCPKKAFFLPAKELFCCLLLCPGRERRKKKKKEEERDIEAPCLTGKGSLEAGEKDGKCFFPFLPDLFF